MNYNFKKITIIQPVDDMINVVLSKTQRKTPTVVHPQFQIGRIRAFYMRKIKFTSESISEKLTAILEEFPKLDDIHPFFADLINVLYDRDHYKIALGHVSSCKNIVTSITRDYLRLMKYSDSLYRCKMLKRAALGRMVTSLKKLKSTLGYLEEVRKHLARMPSIDPLTRTLIVTGFPNVGKSSFVNNVTNANVEVQAYPFTTQSVFVGHMYEHNVQWQVLDTPGLLDHALEERNTIEMQAITALAHLKACVLFFMDLSETCGYSLELQMRLFQSIKPTFANKPHLIVLTKSDLKKLEDMEQDKRRQVENLAQENNIELIALSNKSKDGIQDVKQKACEMLLAFRLNNPTVGKAATAEERRMDELRIVYPSKIREDLRPKPSIPEHIVQGKKIPLGRPTLKQMEAEFGGAGAFYFPAQEHFMLDNPEWKYDAVPEIMNGKNLVDFVDPDILEKLQKLEEEEEILLSINIKPEGDDMEEEKDSEIRAAFKEIKAKTYKKKLEHMMKRHKKDPTKVRVLSDLKAKLEEKGLETDKVQERFKDSKKERKPLTLNELEDEMDIEEEGEDEEEQLTNKLRRRAERKQRSFSHSRSKSVKTKDEIAKLKVPSYLI
jgi:nucleolar GTP-binding protein